MANRLRFTTNFHLDPDLRKVLEVRYDSLYGFNHALIIHAIYQTLIGPDPIDFKDYKDFFYTELKNNKTVIVLEIANGEWRVTARTSLTVLRREPKSTLYWILRKQELYKLNSLVYSFHFRFEYYLALSRSESSSLKGLTTIDSLRQIKTAKVSSTGRSTKIRFDLKNGLYLETSDRVKLSKSKSTKGPSGRRIDPKK